MKNSKFLLSLSAFSVAYKQDSERREGNVLYVYKETETIKGICICINNNDQLVLQALLQVLRSVESCGEKKSIHYSRQSRKDFSIKYIILSHHSTLYGLTKMFMCLSSYGIYGS